MQGPWFFADDLSSDVITLDSSESVHASASRRLGPGDRCVLFDGVGQLADCEVVDGLGRAAGRRTPPQEFRLAVRGRSRIERPVGGLRLFVAAPKKDRLEWLVEKCTELGGARISLTQFDRSVVHPGDGKLERLKRTTIEACKQSRQPWLPAIDEPLDFDAAIAEAGGRTAAAHAGGATAFSEWLRGGERDEVISLFIGPEGGFSQREITEFAARKIEAVRLAPGILRIETAAVAATAIWSQERIK